MTPKYEPLVQASINAIKRQRERIVSQLEKEFNEKVNRYTSHLDKTLEKIYSENEVIGWELNPFEKEEIEQMNNELDDEL